MSGRLYSDFYYGLAPTYFLEVTSIGTATTENTMEVHQKIKNKSTLLSSNPIYGYISEEIKLDIKEIVALPCSCLLYTSDAADDWLVV